MNEINGFLT